MPGYLRHPHVGTVTFGGYAQSTATAVDDDALTLPGRWVDHHTDHPRPAWISIGWRDHDDPRHTGTRTALHLLHRPGHTETIHHTPLDWLSWTAYTVIAGGLHRGIAALDDGRRGIGPPSLTALRSWLHRWEQAGRPDGRRLVSPPPRSP